MISASATSKRLIEVVPLLAAMAFHAIAFQRWLLVLPIALLLVSTAFSGVSVSVSRNRLVTTCVAGLMAGVAMLAISEPPSGPLPPLVSSGLTGVLIGVATLFFASRRVVAAWISSWILVALSAGVEMSAPLSVAQFVFMGGLLIGAASSAKTFEMGARSILTLSLFTVLVVSATAGIVNGAKRLDGILQQTLQALYSGEGLSLETGIGDEIIVGSRSSVTLSQQAVLEMSIAPTRLRVRVLDQFDGRRWSTSAAIRTARPTLADVPIPRESARELQMVLLDDLGDDLPSPAGTWQVRGAAPRVDGGWILHGKTKNEEVVLTGDEQERLPPESAPGDDHLEVSPELRAALEPLARQLMSAGGTSGSKAEMVERFFQHNFQYTLDTNLVGDEHPLVLLVQERRPAYCIYFASAMAVMLRTQGIPTRIVSGFMPGSINPITGRVTIRQRDAHAWVEAWLAEERRFVAFDPTPSGSRERAIGTAETPGIVSACAEALVSVARRAWLSLQRDPARALAAVVKSPISWVFVSLLVVLLVWQRRTERSRAARRPTLEAVDPVLRHSYRRYSKTLRRVGVTPRPWETDEELIERLADASGPLLAAKAKEFITSYRRARYRGDLADERLPKLARLD
jgi:transglutaminase-like putative cysteine protease